MVENTQAKSPFSKLSHVGVVVRDMDKAVKRLESLGIGPFEPLSPLPMTGNFRGKPFTPDCKTLMAKMGEIGLELLQPVKGESPWQEFLDSKGEGIHHIAFDVDDIDEMVTKLTEQGACVILTGKLQGRLKSAYVDLGIGSIILSLFQG